ncbi:hexokinase-2-like isoform X2 [Lytechinus variegatus]|uniref:hexokinase-2-like isoform X2 n=1 Tax=Lytechinus variegatus TaxID=7654 RepID=UPI001BB1F965|nr:hexokinase-2-like isoform X2 [Lytechinus variegatus]
MSQITIPEPAQGILKPFDISLELMKDIGVRLTKEMTKGLDKATHDEAKVKMFPTYVQSLPDGTERGDFFALDLGGSNFRVLLVRLLEGEVKMESKTYAIDQKFMVGTGDQLFDYIADCLNEFKKEQDLLNKSLPLGFTFSFPCRQKSLKSGNLTTWTKGFKASGVEGQDVVELLNEACKRKGVAIDVIALVNDTTGTLMSCAYSDHNTYVGLILGTGTNACYMEDVNKVGTWAGDGNARETIVNMEWGAFGDNGVLDDIRTEYDMNVDSTSLNQGKQLYEKMISGMYLGEISRQVMVKLVQAKLLFNGVSSTKLDTANSFETRFLTDIENDDSNNGMVVTEILNKLDLDPSIDDIMLVRAVCHSVAKRAARLAVAGLAAVTKKVHRENRPEVTIGIDGTLYKKHPLFKKEMEEMMKQLVPGVKVNFMLSEDGSGKGAALIAAVACRLHNNKAH